MKRFFLKIALFIIIVSFADYALGLILKSLENSARGGMTYRDNYICNQLTTDILISGSSRCVHHYNPQIITDSLGLSSYNSGQMGNGIILNYGRLLMIGEREKPKIVIYDLHPGFDILVGDDNHRYLSWLKSHYEREGIAEIFASVDKTEKYKMMSRMYRYNSRIIELLADYLHPIDNARANGFFPLDGDMDLTKIRSRTDHESGRTVDKLKMMYIEKMIEEAKGSRIVFVVSPIWYGMDSRQYEPVKSICREKGIEFYDFANDPKYVHHNEFFKDGSHMNTRGADEFTKDLIECLKEDI